MSRMNVSGDPMLYFLLSLIGIAVVGFSAYALMGFLLFFLAPFLVLSIVFTFILVLASGESPRGLIISYSVLALICFGVFFSDLEAPAGHVHYVESTEFVSMWSPSEKVFRKPRVKWKFIQSKYDSFQRSFYGENTDLDGYSKVLKSLGFINVYDKFVAFFIVVLSLFLGAPLMYSWHLRGERYIYEWELTEKLQRERETLKRSHSAELEKVRGKFKEELKISESENKRIDQKIWDLEDANLALKSQLEFVNERDLKETGEALSKSDDEVESVRDVEFL